MCDTHRIEFEAGRGSTMHRTVEGTRTDRDGRFTLENVPKSLVYLRLDGEHCLPLEYGRNVEGSFSELANGKVYNNLYNFQHVVRDGKIVAVREYLDTQHVQDIFGAD